LDPHGRDLFRDRRRDLATGPVVDANDAHGHLRFSHSRTHLQTTAGGHPDLATGRGGAVGNDLGEPDFGGAENVERVRPIALLAAGDTPKMRAGRRTASLQPEDAVGGFPAAVLARQGRGE